ncbi:MAG: hypothetical protein U5N86_02185 [Planctomycetota bacterium]|nr:hypothetical protein [Planctomycetota bacterium]
MRTQNGLKWQTEDYRRKVRDMDEHGIDLPCPSACISVLVMNKRKRR